MAASSSDEIGKYEPSFVDRIYDTDFINGKLFPEIVRSYTSADRFIECFSGNGNIRCISVAKNGAPYGSKMIMLFFHGNSCDLGDCQDLLINYSNWFSTIVFGIEYSGYGMCEGKRTPKDIIESCADSVMYIKKILNIPLSRMVLYGHSVGGAIALQINAMFQQSFAGIILHNTFSTIKKVVSSHSLVSSVFVSDKFLSNVEAMKTVGFNQHILIIHGEKDEIIPKECAEELYSNCYIPRERKVLKICSQSTHNAFVAQTHRFLHILPFFRAVEEAFFKMGTMRTISFRIDKNRCFTDRELAVIELKYGDYLRRRKQQMWIESDGKCQLKVNIFSHR